MAATDKAGKRLERLPSARPDGKPTDSGWRPKRPCCRQKGKLCLPAEWRGQGWRELETTMRRPHSFQYRVMTRGKGRRSRVTIEAWGDPGCDGHPVRYRMTLTMDGKRLTPARRVRPAGPPPGGR